MKNMKIYMAPMEGLTGHIFRQCFEKHFGNGYIDKYYIPFISPNQSNGYTARERADIEPENNKDINAVPQIMANDAKLFIKAMNMLKEMGYKEININLGCPSGTVVTKFRGAGFLAKPEELDAFLKEVTKEAKQSDMRISVKTRLGMKDYEEFKYLLNIYNDYDLEEVIIHPRVREDYYNNTPNFEMFEYALLNSTNPVSFNGDIYRLRDYKVLCERFPQLESVMIGRGFVGNPFLLEQIKQNADCGDNLSSDINKRMKAFLSDLLKGYKQYLNSEVNSMHKMKEVWIYTAKFYEGGDKALKNIKKAKRTDEYMAAVNEFFKEAVYDG